MTRLTLLPNIIMRAALLDVRDPIRDACRQRLAEMRDRCASRHELAKALGCSARHAQRVLRRYAIRDYTEQLTPRTPKQSPSGHPPASWCSCAACRVARGAALAV